MEIQELNNCVLHEIRNSHLLVLSAEIQIAEMEGKDIAEIYDAYTKFSVGLEKDIERALETFKKK